MVYLSVFSCDTTEPGNDNFELNPKLHSVFYWGYQYPGPRVPNIGLNEGPPIQNPTWASDKTIYFTTTHLDENDILQKGIFKIEINPNDYSLVNNEYHIYEYEHDILDMSYINSTDEFLLLVSKDGNSEAVIVQIEEDNLVEKEVLVDNSWNVEGITVWYKGEGFIFYGRNPQTGISGFYGLVKDSNATYQKELIYSIEDPGLNRQSFITSYDGKTFYFGLNDSRKYYGAMQLLKLSLREEGAMPIVVLERKGGYIDVAQNPIDQLLFLVNFYNANEPQGHIELFNSVTLHSIDLKVRTHSSRMRFILSEHPSWSPNGEHFAFSAGAFDGEGGIYHLELWIYENVP